MTQMKFAVPTIPLGITALVVFGVTIPATMSDCFLISILSKLEHSGRTVGVSEAWPARFLLL